MVAAGKDQGCYLWIATYQPQSHASFSGWHRAQDPSPRKMSHSCSWLSFHLLQPSSWHRWSCCWQCSFHLPVCGPRPCLNHSNCYSIGHKTCCCPCICVHSVWILLIHDLTYNLEQHLCLAYHPNPKRSPMHLQLRLLLSTDQPLFALSQC